MKKIIILALLAFSSLTIFATTPTVLSVKATAGTYKFGTQVLINIKFDSVINVQGYPRLSLNTGTNVSYATYLSGSKSNTLVFAYTVALNDNANPLEYTSIAALILNGGSIKALASGIVANLTLPGFGSGNSLSSSNVIVDGVIPIVTKVSGASADGSYKIGDGFDIVVTFSKQVTMSAGTANLLLNTGLVKNAAHCVLVSASTSTTFTFHYVVNVGDYTTDLNYASTNALTLNAGTTITDAAGNKASLLLPNLLSPNSLMFTSNIVIDAVPAKVTNVTSPTINGSYNAGNIIYINVVFSKVVTVTPNSNSEYPLLTLLTKTTLTTNTGNATYYSGSGTNTLTFKYVVQTTDYTLALDYNNTTSLACPNHLGSLATIQDDFGNDAVLTLVVPAAGNLGSLSRNKKIILDNNVPSVTAVTSTDGTYIIGNPVYINVVFSKPVAVTGFPKLELASGGSVNQYAIYFSGSNTTTLKFKYVVQSGDISAKLNYASNSSLTLNGGTITDKAGNLAVLSLLNATALSSNNTVKIEGVQAYVTNITSSFSSYHTPGDIIPIVVSFNTSVDVTSTPKLLLETGTIDRYAVYASTSGADLTFNYTVMTGDNTIKLEYKATNSLALFGGTIKDHAYGNNAILNLPAPTTAGSLSANANIIIVAVPKVVNVTATTNNGSYNAGSVIRIAVIFSLPVTVSGTPTLTLSTMGSANEVVNYFSTVADTLIFKYTVQSGDASTDLDYVATNPLALNGGTIVSANVPSVSANLTLPVPGATGSLSRNKAIVIDNVAPTANDVNSIPYFSNPVPGATGPVKHIIGETVFFYVLFSKTVIVTGAPQLELQTTTANKYAMYVSGSNTTILKFMYTVKSGDINAHLDYATPNPLTLNGGTIKDKAGNAANLTTLPANGRSLLYLNNTVNIEGVPPVVSSVSDTTQANTTFTSGTIHIKVAFSKIVNVSTNGAPRLLINTGSGSSFANYASGTGTTNLVFDYVISPGDYSSALDYVSTGSLMLNGSTIKDADFNNAVLTLPALGGGSSLSSSTITVDAVPPKVTNVTSTAANGYYNLGSTIYITVTFSKNVTVAGGTPQLTLATLTNETINYFSGSGSNTLTFTYIVQATDASSDLDYVSTSSLSPGAGTIRDVAGNDANLTLPTPHTYGSLSYNKNIIIDGIVPTITSINSSNSNGSYNTGKTIYIQVFYSEKVIVTGYPQLTLNTTPAETAYYFAGSGTNCLIFSYTVHNGDAASPLDVSLVSGTIKDVAGNIATLTLPTNSLGNNNTIVIDCVAPIVTNVTSSTPNATYNSGAVIAIDVVFSKTVYVSGTPLLTLETGTAKRNAIYTGGYGTNTLTFDYTVQLGDNSADLDYLATSSLTAGDGIIDAAGNAAILTMATPGAAGSLSNNKAIIIDGVSQSVTNVTSLATGIYHSNAVISIDVIFSEPLFVSTGTPQLTLETGTTDENALYISGSGTNKFTFHYIVQLGDQNLHLDYVLPTSLSGVIVDNVGNSATLTLPTPGAAGSLGANTTINIDGSTKSAMSGIQNINTSTVNVYPVPSKGNITLEMSGFANKNKTITVFDSFGRTVYSGTTSSDTRNLSLKFSSGIYSVLISTDNQKVYKKLIIE